MKYIKTYENYNDTTIMDVSGNGLSELNKLPEDLIELNCEHNNLESLPELPKTLKLLYCYVNNLTELPELPIGLTNLVCQYNKLKRLPDIPIHLEEFKCNDNDWEEPIKSEYAIMVDCNPYNKEQIALFSSEEFQRKFLNEHPDRFKDLSCWGIEVNDVIRKEFPWIFEGDSMGFFDLKTKESK